MVHNKNKNYKLTIRLYTIPIYVIYKQKMIFLLLFILYTDNKDFEELEEEEEIEDEISADPLVFSREEFDTG